LDARCVPGSPSLELYTQLKSVWLRMEERS
jgi:hypothetical protein